ncbi:MAG: hypothetical protein L0Z62_42910 [Gemmataceae bacterium]|nr:hypothetical protein [Gemmataceae bacterium]
MRFWLAWLTVLAALGGSGFLILSSSIGQERLPAPPAPAVAPTPAKTPAHDFNRFTVQQKQLYGSARTAADWLQRCVQPDGRFGYVATTALRGRNDNDHYLRQAGAAVALARSARFFQDEQLAASATRSLLTLLLATAADEKDPQARHTTVPTTAVNRLAAAGLLTRGILELPAPAADLLAQADQLCHYVRLQQRADGGLGAEAGNGRAVESPEAADAHAAEALHGLAVSQRLRPAPWKVESLRKALAHYHPRWQARKALAPVPGLVAAWTEAYLATKERPFADAVLELCDWLGTLQYREPDPVRPLWAGGFKGWTDGRAALEEPTITSARHAEALADGCRVTRQLGDALRHPRYRDALNQALGFVLTLQFTSANTQHFAGWYQREVVGAFHASHQDGNLRLDYTQHGTCALLHHLTHVAELP